MIENKNDESIRELRHYLMESLVSALHNISPHVSDSQLRAIAVSFENKSFEQAENLEQYLESFSQKFSTFGRGLPDVTEHLDKLKKSNRENTATESLQPFDSLDSTTNWHDDNDLMSFLAQIGPLPDIPNYDLFSPDEHNDNDKSR